MLDSTRYEVKRVLGRGGMGIVYEALDRERHERVALKTMCKHDPLALYRFKREFRVLADIRHRNLVSLYDMHESGGSWFYTMELIDGVDFRRYLAGEAIVDIETASLDEATATIPTMATNAPAVHRAQLPFLDEMTLRATLRQLAVGINALHMTHHLHRDIKPANVLIGRDGRVALCDFGLVHEVARGAESDGLLAGTVTYMSPEQAAAESLGEASDWYSFGVLLFIALTGHAPFEGDPRAVARRKRAEEAPWVAVCNPSAPGDLASLCDALLRRDPGARPTAADVLAVIGSSRESDDAGVAAAVRRATNGVARLFGRRVVLDRLSEAAARARAGSAITAVVHGPSGIGKSAVVDYFVATQRVEHDALVLTGRCYERESVPHKALDPVIDALTDHLLELDETTRGEILPRGVAALARLFPVLRRAGIGDRSGATHPDPVEVRRAAFAALRELLGRLAARRPTILWIDDLQWGDIDSGRLLRELLRPPGAPPILVIVSHRSVVQSRLIDAMVTAIGEGVLGEVVDVPIEPLSFDEAHELAAALLGGAARTTTAEDIARESGGNPYYVRELVHHVHGGGAARGPSLDAVMSGRIARLETAPRQLLTAIAVAGGPVPLGVAGAAADLTARHEVLMALRGAHLVRTLGFADSNLAETYHDRVREAVLAALSPDEVSAWHRRLAESYERHGGGDLESLADHWRLAGDVSRAVRYALMAADNANEAFAFDRAIQLYRSALASLAELPDGVTTDVDRRSVEVLLADALANAGRGVAAAKRYLAASEGADPTTALELRRRAAEQWLFTGYLGRGVPQTETVLSSIGMRLARSPWTALVSLLWRRARLRVFGLRIPPPPTSPVEPGDLSRLDMLWSVATGLSCIDNIRGADFQARYLVQSLRVGEPSRVARSLALEVSYYACDGNRSRRRTDRMAAVARSYADQFADPRARAFVTLTTGVGRYLRGDWAEAVDQLRPGEQMLREQCAGVAWEQASAVWFRLGAEFFLGDLGELAREVPEALRAAADRSNLYAAVMLRTWYTNAAWLVLDQPDEAERQIAIAQRDWSWPGFHLQHHCVLLAQVHLDLYRGDGAAAGERIHQAWSPLRRSLLRRVELIDMEAHHLRGRAAVALAAERAARGRRDDRLLARAVADARRIARIRHPYARGLAAAILAAAAAQTGDRQAALRRLDDADGCFAVTRMRAYGAAARLRRGQLLGGAGGSALERAAHDDLAELGVRDPERFARMLLPGFS